MYARRIRFNNQRWNCVVHPDKYLSSSSGRDYSIGTCLSSGSRAGYRTSRGSLIERLIYNNWSSIGLHSGRRFSRLHVSSDINRRGLLRLYSSEGDGRNASEDKCVPAKGVTRCDKDKIHSESAFYKGKKSDAHARLCEQDQMEWLKNEKLAIESKLKESPFLTRRERFRNEFLRRVVPWEKITVSWDNFPYYIHEPTKNILVECTASHLKNKSFTPYGRDLASSSGKILLQSVPGTELYRERLVRALAQDLKVPLLVLDSSVLAPYDFGEDCSSESESDEDCVSDSENEDANDVSNDEDYTSSGETNGSDNEIDLQASAEALKKLIPCDLEEFEKRVSGDPESSSTSSSTDQSDKSTRHMKKGDRVIYRGPTVLVEANNRIVLGKIPTSDGPRNAFTIGRSREVSKGQKGEVYEVNGDQVAVIFETSGNFTKKDEHDDKSAEPADKPSLCWVNVKDIEHDLDAESHDCYVAMEVLCEILESEQPLIVTKWKLRRAKKREILR